MSIPKKIYYCWFGGEKPQKVVERISNWKEKLPNYEIIEINDKNKELFDVENKCFSEAKETAWIDPKLLYQSLSGFNDDIIKLDFLGENKGVMISSKEAKSIVLPKRKPNDTTTY